MTSRRKMMRVITRRFNEHPELQIGVSCGEFGPRITITKDNYRRQFNELGSESLFIFADCLNPKSKHKYVPIEDLDL